jgi:AraC family transcriptional activator of tynA and feaB
MVRQRFKPIGMQAVMHLGEDFSVAPVLGFEEWRETLRAVCGTHNPESAQPKEFAGWVRFRNICGFEALDLSCNASRVERTLRDVRVEGGEDYYVVFQVAGASTMIQNDEAVQLSVGDAALVDTARPVTYVCENRNVQWLALHLPRRSLVSHFGFEPQGGSSGRGTTRAGRLLFQLLSDALEDGRSISPQADPYMQLAVYGLLGAAFTSSGLEPASSHTDKLFRRVHHVVKSHFADPGFGPSDVAAEVGISLRYLQEIFTARGSTCTQLIQSLRLDHAARLLDRRATLGTRQSLSEIAYACGFSDYNHFARTFRRRFGHSPSAHELADK